MKNQNLNLCFCRYKDALVLLLREVLNRIQFRYNQAQLEELDDETLDDDVRTIDLQLGLCFESFVFFSVKYPVKRVNWRSCLSCI